MAINYAIFTSGFSIVAAATGVTALFIKLLGGLIIAAINRLVSLFFLIVWWGKIGHCFGPWHFPVYIEPLASFLLLITTYRKYILSFLLTDCFPTD